MGSLLLKEAVVAQLIFLNAHQLPLEHPPTQSHQNGLQSSLSKLPQIQSHNRFLASFILGVQLQ